MLAVLFRIAAAVLDLWLVLACVVAFATVAGSLVLTTACERAQVQP